MSIGIIGFGRIGRLLVRHLAMDHRIVVYDVHPRKKEVRALGAESGTLAEACRQDLVIPCVPIADFENVIRKIAPILKEGAVLMDVCSVKEHPVRAMKRWLPRGVQILATHPTFGPDSAAETLRGRQIVVCKVRIKPAAYRRILSAFKRKGLDVKTMSPTEHDRKMASSLVMTHFIGRTLEGLKAKPTGIDTEGYRRLLRILQTVENDSWQLFHDMNRYNRYADGMRRRFLEVMGRIDRRVSHAKHPNGVRLTRPKQTARSGRLGR